MIKKILIIILLILISNIKTFACGLATHQEIMEEARALIDENTYPELYEMINLYPDSSDSGAVYPDGFWALKYLFNDPYFDEVAYFAHQYVGNFNETFINYLKENHPAPYSPTEKKIINYFFGIISHQTADRIFHPNFLREAIEHDNTAEIIVEPFMDIWCMWELGEREEWTDWFVPMEDLLAVHQLGGYPITENELLFGVTALKIGIFVEHFVGPVTYYITTLILPWTHENYMDYPVGGVRNLAEETANSDIEAWLSINNEQFGINSISRPLKPTFKEEPINLFLIIASDLIYYDCVEVPIEYTEEGAVILKTPEITDLDRFLQILSYYGILP